MDVGLHGSDMMRRTLFPELEPYETGFLGVDEPHHLYWEQSGNPDGVPVVFLHGGPGAGAVPAHRRFFDPRHYRIVIFDQRGAGRSTPLGDLTRNTTADLVADTEKLRTHLGIERWFVFGGSWGSSLALAYGEAHPDRCRALILRGIFLCRKDEIDWFMTGMRRLFPEAWSEFANYLPAAERGDLLHNYHRRLIDPDPEVHLPAARAWSRYEGSCSTLRPNPDAVTSFLEPATALGLARIEAHYFVNDCFMPEGALLENVGRLEGVPGVIVQGRYDAVCPVVSAVELAEVWRGARLQIVSDAGHSAMEPGIRSELIATMERFKSIDDT
jgi:proline iminopeptidase